MNRILIGAGVAALALLPGCSNLGTQIATLQPVAGDAITGLNIAANDVLLREKVDILVAPVCTYEPETYTCTGTTVKGDEILVTAQGAKPTTFTVSVGGASIYDGPVDAVIKRAGQR